MRHAFMLLAMLGPAGALAQTPGDAEAGRRLAATWCASCHVIGQGAAPLTGTDAAPSFAAVAAQPSSTALSLRVFLTATHSRMPRLQLSRDEQDDLIGYILSLRATGSPPPTR